MDGSVPRGDLEVPAEVLARLTFRSQRGERGLKHVRDGQLTSSIGLQGIYRLTEASAADLDSVVNSPPPASPRIPRAGRIDRRTVPAPEDVLF